MSGPLIDPCLFTEVFKPVGQVAVPKKLVQAKTPAGALKGSGAVGESKIVSNVLQERRRRFAGLT